MQRAVGNYEFILPAGSRDAAITNLGALERTHGLLAKLQRGEGSAEEFRHDVARREARDAARVEELERDKGRLTRAKQAEADEYEARVAPYNEGDKAALERRLGYAFSWDSVCHASRLEDACWEALLREKFSYRGTPFSPVRAGYQGPLAALAVARPVLGL